MDLRRKVFAAWRQGEASQAEVGARFAVSESFVGDLVALHRQTGDVAARPRGGGRPSLATPALSDRLASPVTAQHDHTIAEHHQSLLAAGFALSAATVGRLLFAPATHAQKKPLQGRPS